MKMSDTEEKNLLTVRNSNTHFLIKINGCPKILLFNSLKNFFFGALFKAHFASST